MLRSALFLFVLLLIGQTPSAFAQTKTIYHLHDSVGEARIGLQNIRNHLFADKSAQIVVVANGPASTFVLKGTADNAGKQFESDIRELAKMGVDFRVCENSLNGMHKTKADVVNGVQVVPSGVAEIAKLESQGYGYIKP